MFQINLLEDQCVFGRVYDRCFWSRPLWIGYLLTRWYCEKNKIIIDTSSYEYFMYNSKSWQLVKWNEMAVSKLSHNLKKKKKIQSHIILRHKLKQKQNKKKKQFH